MSTIAPSNARSVAASLIRGLHSVAITVPATSKARAATLADARRIYGLDLDDDTRAERILSRRAR